MNTNSKIQEICRKQIQHIDFTINLLNSYVEEMAKRQLENVYF